MLSLLLNKFTQCVLNHIILHQASCLRSKGGSHKDHRKLHRHYKKVHNSDGKLHVADGSIQLPNWDGGEPKVQSVRRRVLPHFCGYEVNMQPSGLRLSARTNFPTN